ncbi:MAG: hypothetical protein NC419_07720 [Muribaculaceae bacterium]|nr:hypothetical protein [Muribaculaceae bacterium]
MKIVKKILYGIMGLFVLCCGLILLCAAKPELSGQLADVLGLGEEAEDLQASASGVISTDDGGDTPYLAEPENTEDGDNTEDETGRDYETRPGGVVWSEPDTQYPKPQNTSTQGNSEDTEKKIDPSALGLSVPENVAGKNGYEPVQGNNSEIDDEEADRLFRQLSTGQTGDGLTFDAQFYPYYYMLDDAGKHLYRQIYANANALTEQFAPVEDVSVTGLKNTFAAVYNDHPELFWMDTAYSCKYRSNGQCAEIDLQFNYTAEDLRKETATFEEKSNEIVNEAKNLESDYEKEKYVHDKLLAKADYVAYAKINQSAYSALVNGRTVCAGYARAFQYMLQQLGIPCYYCTGYAGESHAWNIVALEGGYYNVDVTWDDTGAGTYTYFNRTDMDIAGNHLRQDLSVNLPACNGTTYRNLEKTDDTEADKDKEKEQNQDTGDNRRSLADLGMTKENTLSSLEDYYNSCYQNLLLRGKGNYTFSNAIAGSSVFQDVCGAYDSRDYRQGYIDSVMTDLDASNYRIDWRIEALQDDYYLVTHDVVIE